MKKSREGAQGRNPGRRSRGEAEERGSGKKSKEEAQGMSPGKRSREETRGEVREVLPERESSKIEHPYPTEARC